jgi:cytoskeletal protein RodZ
MNNIGETLRRERLAQGLDLKQLADSTKISGRMLQAMEEGDLSRLPGGVFTRSFFKQYASVLGLDPTFVEAEIRQLSGDPEQEIVARERKTQYTPFESAEPPSNSLTAATVWVVLALVGCGGVYYLVKNYQTSTTTKPVVSAASAPEAPKIADTPATTVSAPATPEQTPTSSQALQVVLNASEESWVSVTVDGKLLFTGILQPNDRREINAEEKVKVIAGNAGGLDISLNGKNIDSLGPRGQVRTVELTRAGAQVVSRTSKPDPLL